MVSLNTPIGDGGAELLDLYGVEDTASEAVDAADALARPLSRLRPLDRALLVQVRTGHLSIDEAATRLGVTPRAVIRRVNRAERKARGRKRGKSRDGSPGSGVERPIGTVVLRRSPPARWIKVRMDGPPKNRWMLYATWLWVQRHGPVPRDRCVIHRDGDTLNDDPGNLVLGGHADRAYLWQARQPDFERAMRACREACRRSNHERALARDLAGVLRLNRWYAVDHTEKTIVGPYGRSARHVFEAVGVPRPPGTLANGCRPLIASQLGWPGLPSADAVVLAVLADRSEDSMSRPEIVDSSLRLVELIDAPVSLTTTVLNQALYRLRKAGLVASCRGGRLPSRHRATAEATARRGRVVLVAAVRGDRCVPLKDNGYRVLPGSRRDLAATA